jgi:hypothetical protein
MIRSSWLPPTGLMPTGRVYMFAVFMSEAAGFGAGLFSGRCRALSVGLSAKSADEIAIEGANIKASRTRRKRYGG